MPTTHIDTTRLKNDIDEMIAECINMKHLLRTRWTRPMAEEQRRLVRLRRKLTEHLILLATSRNKLHVIHAPRAVRGRPNFAATNWDAASYNETTAARLLPDYALAPLESRTRGIDEPRHASEM